MPTLTELRGEGGMLRYVREIWKRFFGKSTEVSPDCAIEVIEEGDGTVTIIIHDDEIANMIECSAREAGIDEAEYLVQLIEDFIKQEADAVS